MKVLSYILGMIILISGVDVMFTTASACPRCRRALPKGPRKRPHPGFPKKETLQSLAVKNSNENSSKTGTKEFVNEAK
jgi:hypothetical protein